MSAALSLAKFQMLDITEVAESELNPRRQFDETKLGELTASVREKGVLEPILVRPTKKPGAPGFEVAAGARRLRAALAAKMTHIPAMVRDMTDTELLEVALLENVVRHDISALDEGDAYRTLVKEHGYTVEQLIEKTGKSRTVVFQRMKLGELEGPIRARLEAGHLQASVAELLARLPTQPMREAALKVLEEKAHWRGKDGVDLSGIPFKEAKEILDADFRLVLKEATFDVKAVDLVVTAGACTACPKRTAADKELFPGIKEDHCLDAACWKAKEKASFALLKAEVKAQGKDLVKVTDLYDRYDKSRLTGSVASKFDKPTAEVTGEKTWKQLLGADVPTVVVMDKAGKTLNLVDKEKALELLEAKDPKTAEKVKKATEKAAPEDWQAKRREEDLRWQKERLLTRLVQRAALDKVTKPEAALELLLLSWSHEDYDWPRQLQAVGLDKKTDVKKLKAADIAALLVRKAFESRNEDFTESSAKALKVDLKALRKQAADAERGTCIACGTTEAKGAVWVDATQLLCASCDGSGEED